MDDLSPLNIMVCIPAYNEEGRIGKVVEVAKKYATRVVVFDYGSTDNTAEISRNNGATVIKNEKNEGYGKAISGLLKFAKENDVDIMVTIDSDGQHDPYQIPSITRPLLNKECDIVIGSRFIRDHDTDRIPRYRKFGIKTITKAIQIASYNSITDTQSGFRAYNKIALSKLRLYDKGMSVSTEILLEAKNQDLKIIEVPITVCYDSENLSTQHPLFHGLGVLSSVIRFITYSRPLLFYTIPWVVLFVVAAVFANQAREIYIQSLVHNTGYTYPTSLILVSIGAALVGSVCLSTGAVIYTVMNLFKSEIHDV